MWVIYQGICEDESERGVSQQVRVYIERGVGVRDCLGSGYMVGVCIHGGCI